MISIVAKKVINPASKKGSKRRHHFKCANKIIDK